MATISEMIATFPNKEGQDAQTVALLAIAGAIERSNGIGVQMGFREIQMLNRLGLAQKALAAGDQIAVQKMSSISATVSGSITAAAVDEETFIAKVGEVKEGVYEFSHNGAAWHLDGAAVDLGEYGITVTGTAADGDLIEVHETAGEILFDIADFNKHHPANRNLKYSIQILCSEAVAGFPYNPPQALATVKTGSLPAGSYCFGVDANYDANYNSHEDGNVVFFVLTQPVPEGGQIMLSWPYNTLLKDAKISTYAKFSTTAIESNIAVEMTAAVGVSVHNLGTNTNGELAEQIAGTTGATMLVNNASRARYGSNDVRSAVMLQWLGSAKKNGWHEQVSPFDRPQTTPTAGFLYGVDPAFLAILGKVKLRSAFNTVCKCLSDVGDTTANYYDGEHLGWLPSMTELGWGANNSVVEGSPDSEGNVGTAAEATFALFQGASNADRIRRNNGTARGWFLRSPYPSNAGNERRVTTGGALIYNGASDGYWAVPGLDII